MSHQIAIDGPAGAGKSTIAKIVSARLGFIYVDTGAMYRAMALYLSRKKIDLDNQEEIGAMAQSADISIKYLDGQQVVMLGDENVNDLIRNPEISAMASKTSPVALLRQKLVQLQQKLADTQNVVMDGRDIGTVVLPKADLKIYLTASVQVRAKRRYDEMIHKGQSAELTTIEKDIEERDYRDMHRETSPLKQADDAILVDTSDMSIEQVADKIIELYNNK